MKGYLYDDTDYSQKNSNNKSHNLRTVVITIACVLIVLFLYGYFLAMNQLENGVSILEISITAKVLPPIIKNGYLFVIHNNDEIQYRIKDINNN